jgi:hypothetical protein
VGDHCDTRRPRPTRDLTRTAPARSFAEEKFVLGSYAVATELDAAGDATTTVSKFSLGYKGDLKERETIASGGSVKVPIKAGSKGFVDVHVLLGEIAGSISGEEPAKVLSAYAADSGDVGVGAKVLEALELIGAPLESVPKYGEFAGLPLSVAKIIVKAVSFFSKFDHVWAARVRLAFAATAPAAGAPAPACFVQVVDGSVKVHPLDPTPPPIKVAVTLPESFLLACNAPPTVVVTRVDEGVEHPKEAKQKGTVKMTLQARLSDFTAFDADTSWKAALGGRAGR